MQLKSHLIVIHQFNNLLNCCLVIWNRSQLKQILALLLKWIDHLYSLVLHRKLLKNFLQALNLLDKDQFLWVLHFYRHQKFQLLANLQKFLVTNHLFRREIALWKRFFYKILLELRFKNVMKKKRKRMILLAIRLHILNRLKIQQLHYNNNKNKKKLKKNRVIYLVFNY